MLLTVPRIFYLDQEPLQDPKALKTEVNQGLMAEIVEGTSGEKDFFSASDTSASC